MKKLTIFAIAALAAVGLSSCIKEKIGGTDIVESNGYKLTVRLAGAEASRAVGEQGSANKAAINDLQVYVFGEDGLMVAAQGFTKAEAAAGMVLDQMVPSGSEVFVVGNTVASKVILPATSNATTLAEIMSAMGDVAELTPTTDVPLATINAVANAQETKVFAAQPITVVDQPTATAYGTATATIMLSPTVARLEVVAIEARADVDGTNEAALDNGYQPTNVADTSAGFTVEGVYLTGYAPRYTFSGTSDGTALDYIVGGTGNVGDPAPSAGAWTASSGRAVPTLVGGTNPAWVYNVAAGDTSEIWVVVKSTIAENENAITGDLNNDGDSNDTGVLAERDVKVKSYGTTTEFKPGVIYRIAYVPFDKQIFSLPPDILEDFELTVNIDVVAWDVVSITPEMN